MRKGIVLILSILYNYSNVYSQSIKFGVAFSGITREYKNTESFTIGYDHNVGEKNSFGLSYKIGFPPYNSSLGTPYSFSSPDGTVNFQVSQQATWHEFSYTSKYFLYNNSDADFYVSSGISLLKSKNEYEVTSLSVNNDPNKSQYKDLSEGIFTQNVTLIPLSIDFGHRGEYDRWFLDYFVGISILPFGANPDIEPAALANHGVETMFSSFSFRYGASFGISWVK